MKKNNKLVVYTKSIAKIAFFQSLKINRFIPFPMIIASSMVLIPMNMFSEQTMGLDTLKYPALVEETYADNGEYTKEKVYVHPNTVYKYPNQVEVTISYPWEKDENGFEKVIEQYQLNKNEAEFLKELLLEKKPILELKDMLKLVKTTILESEEINGSNALSYAIVETKIDKTDTITKKETASENAFMYYIAVPLLIFLNFMALAYMDMHPYADFEYTLNKKIKEEKAKIKSLKNRQLKFKI